jgi:hypothetical protein
VESMADRRLVDGLRKVNKELQSPNPKL